MTSKNAILGIGNAICDIVVKISDDFFSQLKFKKGSMHLVSEEESVDILEKIVKASYVYEVHSGGSVANTMYYLSKFGVKSCFIGNVAKGTFGQKFLKDTTESGVKFINVHKKSDNRSAKSIILVTPDGERTMLTYLGCAGNLALRKVPDFHIDLPKFIYIEAYLFDNPATVDEIQNFIRRDIFKKSKLVISLSDGECVKRNKEIIDELITKHAAIIIGNKTEIMSVISAKDFAEEEISNVQKLISSSAKLEQIIVTLSERGAIYITEQRSNYVPARGETAIDSTGAGDAFAAGFMDYIAKGNELEDAVANGNYIAAQVVKEMGGRVKVKMQ